MRFEDAIQTKKFQSENQKAQLNIIYTASVLKCYMTNYFKAFDMTIEQYNVLRIVRGQSPKSVKVKDISARILHRNSNTTRIIDKLEAKGLLRRQDVSSDKRAVHVQLTPQGIALMKKIDQQMQRETPHLKTLDETEAAVLSRLLDRVREDFDAQSQEQDEEDE